MCALHRTSPISDAALSNDVDRRCNRIAMPLRRAFGICFPAISLVAAWPLLPSTRPVYRARIIDRLVGPFAAIGVLRAIADIWPLARDLGRFQVYAYQQRQPVAAHDLENASTLALRAAGTGPHRKMAGSANRVIAPARGSIAGRFGQGGDSRRGNGRLNRTAQATGRCERDRAGAVLVAGCIYRSALPVSVGCWRGRRSRRWRTSGISWRSRFAGRRNSQACRRARVSTFRISLSRRDRAVQ